VPTVSAEQFFVLFRIQANEGCHQADLADPYLNDAPNVTRLVDALSAKGVVERQADPNDRRRHALYLTEKGHRLWHELELKVQSERQTLYEGISQSDATAFLKTIDALETNATGVVRGEALS
jgi:MarR family transcriptional regulator, transcriptional regulator for hemolysin